MPRKKKVEVQELEIFPAFEPLFDDTLDSPRYYQVYGGRGSGKSFAVSIAMVELTYSPYQHKILYLRQSMSTAEDSTISDIKTAIEVIGAQKDFRISKGVVTNITTGIQIIFKGIRSSGSATAKLKSLSGVTTMVVEEAEEIENFEEFSKVDESIRMKGIPLKVILIYNPTSALSSWIHKEYFMNGQPNRERFVDTMFIHTTYLDNLKNLNATTIASYERHKHTNPTYYKNTILAEWTMEVSGKLYEGWGMYPEFDNDGDTWYGLDFGYGGKDKTSLVKVTYFDKVYYVEEMFSAAGLTLRNTLRKMRESQIPFTARIYADHMPLLVDEIRRGGYSDVRKAKKGNVESGIKKIQNKDIVLIGDKTTGLYFGYMTFKRNKNGKLPHEPDELAALRYAINSKKPIEGINKVRPRRARRTTNKYI